MTSGPLVSSSAAQQAAAERRRRAVLAEVREGLLRTPRELPSKYFYDEAGSNLFEEITQLPEYYLTRAEREILVARASDIVAIAAPRTLVELGAGSAAKTRLLLDALLAQTGQATYIPVDVSDEFLQQTGAALEEEYTGLQVQPVVADISEAFELPTPSAGPSLFAFLGSTIGNFDWPSAVTLLRRVRAQMHVGDRFLLGTDLRKDVAVLEAAYNDSQGVTAAFNRNILRVMNAELGADFDAERFDHVAYYDREHHRIEMHLVARGDQTVTIPGIGPVEFPDGADLRTELSHKYDRDAVDRLAEAARLRVTHWFTDSEGRFALSLLEPVG